MGISLIYSVLYPLCFEGDQVIAAQDYDEINYMTRKPIEDYKIRGLEIPDVQV